MESSSGDLPSKPTDGAPWASEPGREAHGPPPVGLEGLSTGISSSPALSIPKRPPRDDRGCTDKHLIDVGGRE